MQPNTTPGSGDPTRGAAREGADGGDSRGIPRFLRDLQNVAAIVKRQGAAEAARQILTTARLRLYSDPADRRWEASIGVNAGGRPIQLNSLTVCSGNRDLGFEFVPTPVRMFTDAVEATGLDLRSYSFVDFGSGKGRLLLRAGQLGFRRVYGVEFASELHEMAQQNIKAFVAATGLTIPIASVHGDATTFTIPDGPCMLYLYNPFTVPVLAKVIDNVQRSYLRDPRHIVIVYLKPTDRELLDKQPFLRPMRIRLRHRLRSMVLHTEATRYYETEPADPDSLRARSPA